MWPCSYPTAAGLAREKKRKAPSPLGEEAEDAILLELGQNRSAVERAIAAWTPRFHGNCAGTVPLLGQFFKLVVI